MVAPASAPQSLCRGRTSAFTLIELLTVLAIIGILAAIIIPTIGKVRQTAHSAQCVSNLRQIGLATKSWSTENKNRTLIGARNNYHVPTAADSWVANVVRYLQNDNQLLGGDWPKNLRCNTWANSNHPNNLNAAATNTHFVGYAMVDPQGIGGSINRGTLLSMSNSTVPSPSKFVYMGERSSYDLWMGRPEASISTHLNQAEDNGLKRHGEKSNYLFLDGSVRAMDLPQVFTAWNATIDMFGPF